MIWTLLMQKHVSTCFLNSRGSYWLYFLSKYNRIFFRHTNLITRDDLIIDWRIFYKWAKLIFNNHDNAYGLIAFPKFVFIVLSDSLPFVFLRSIHLSLILCVNFCSPYFLPTATREILDEFRPQLCPTDPRCDQTIKMLDMFLPVNLPPELHHQGYKFVYIFYLNLLLDRLI
jgi:hypothetical protein